MGVIVRCGVHTFKVEPDEMRAGAPNNLNFLQMSTFHKTFYSMCLYTQRCIHDGNASEDSRLEPGGDSSAVQRRSADAGHYGGL